MRSGSFTLRAGRAAQRAGIAGCRLVRCPAPCHVAESLAALRSQASVLADKKRS